MRELLEPVDLCTATGQLNPEAVGWSRRPLHRCHLPGRWPHGKRWEFWSFTSEELLIQVTVADVDIAGLAIVTLLDLATGKRLERMALVPLAWQTRLPERVHGGPVAFDHLGLHVAIRPGATAVHLTARARALEVDLEIERPQRLESLNVVVPWSSERFHFTSKQHVMQARGTVRWRRRTRPFEGWAGLDHGRGVWSYEGGWYWGAGSGICAGQRVGLNLGGRWTDGTGATENGFWVGDTLHRLGEAMTFRRAPDGAFHIGAPHVDLTLTPLHQRNVGVHLGIVRPSLRWSLGHYSGMLTADDGTQLTIDRLLGWAEEVDAGRQ